MKVNVPNSQTTYEDGAASELTPYKRLRRTVLACLLFENSFYEDGIEASDRIVELCAKCSSLQVVNLALEAAQKYHLRHVPLKLIVEALKLGDKQTSVSNAIFCIITRPDMMCDLLALYWRDGKKPLAHQLKRGLAKAFAKFDEYQLSKYNRDNPIKLRDVLFLCHAKPKDEEQAALWKRLANKELKTADTWESRLSAGKDKKEAFTTLLTPHKMGKLAILRNLRNMQKSGVSKGLVASELLYNPKEMLPFQYIAASKECPQWEDIIDPAMIKSCSLKPKLQGLTIVLVDVSGSMDDALSSKSKMTRMDAACGLAILLRECCQESQFFSFSYTIAPVPPRQGMALRDAIISSQPHRQTMLGLALQKLLEGPHIDYDRIIVITDEQAHDDIPFIPKKKNYILNIAGYKNGIENRNRWTTVTGFSEGSIDFIRELETHLT
jgi:60 kDa SS-A/Ro ribonucleoprotein